jgi:membrane protease YdiL (CAAX protease family)
MKDHPNLKPMPLWESAVLLLVFTALGILCFYVIRPFLQASGLSEMQAYILSLTPVFFVMLAWSCIGFIREGSPGNWNAFLKRFRLDVFKPRLIWLGIGLGALMFSFTIIFSPLIASLVNKGSLPIPAGIPAYVRPASNLPLSALHQQISAPDVVWMIPFMLLLNILAEEIFWRGYVLPRQELTHGRFTFIIHGLLWALSHLFQYWILPSILLSSLALSWLAQRTKSTWPGIIAHLVNNAFPMIVLLILPI